ncbi:hypothetical protein T07_10132 [Trichinella nelsoni]|uniref:Uncharacterized protein n=1 Tax=Trichinella nelsoni TaxID=6336 RepID=A0A0V0RUG5_9BILA|nr:hypothetical protein T07_10132 [Trichinella nelsoni]
MPLFHGDTLQTMWIIAVLSTTKPVLKTVIEVSENKSRILKTLCGFAVICRGNVCIAKVTSTNALQFLFDIHHPSMAATVTDEMWPAGIHTAGQMHMGYFR